MIIIDIIVAIIYLLLLFVLILLVIALAIPGGIIFGLYVLFKRKILRK